MKKMFAILLTVVLVLALSVSALALNSPEAEASNKVHFINGNGAKVETTTVKVGDSITFTADKDKGKFDNWTIYLMDGKTTAVEGTHYTLKEGQSLTDTTIVVTPTASLIVTGNYDGKKTEFQVGQNGEITSPQTGDATVVCLACVMLLALAGMVITKKRTA